MRKFLVGLCVLSLFGCASMDLEKTGGSTGLGSSPFSSGSTFTSSDANAMNDAINDNATDITAAEAAIDAIEAYFSSDLLLHENGGLEADVSAYDGILAITGGATYELNTAAELETAAGLGDLFSDYASADTQADFRSAVDSQQDLDVPSDGELATGTATDERVLTAAKLKYAIEQHSTQIRTLTQEEEDEYVGELVYFDTGNYDPNSVGTDHYAIVTVAGTPGTYVPFLQSDGTWLIDSLATKAVITSDSDGINLTNSDCGKIIYMTGNGEVGLPDCDAGLVGCFVRVDQDDTGRDIEIVMFGDTSNDFFVLEDGTNLDVNNEADIPNAANNRANFICKEANHWFVEEIKGSVTDGGVAD
jgi:hypothetical protein